jgi:hypothetical protein
MQCTQKSCGAPGVGRIYSSTLLEQAPDPDGTLPSEVCPRCKGTGREPYNGPSVVLQGLPLTVWIFGPR